MHHNHAAVVLDLSANGIGIIRSLARKGITVYAFDTEKPYKIGRSRLATCGICPSPLTEEQALLDFLITLAKSKEHKPVLYTGADDYVTFMAKFRQELLHYYLFILPSDELIETLIDKEKTYQLALRHQIPVPKTVKIPSEEALLQVIPELTYPCLLKPVRGHEFRKTINKKAFAIHSEEELRAAYDTYRAHGELILQELIPGDNHCFYKVATFYDENMRLLALFTLQKNHQFPPEFGTGAHIVSRETPELTELCLPFFKELHLTGIGMAEFKKDPRDGVYKFIEINPRFWLTHSLTGASGIDFAYLYYLHLTGQHVKPQLQQTNGVKWIYLVRYYLTYRQKKKAGEMTARDFWRGFRGKKEYALFAWDDLMPFIRSTWSHLKNAWKRRKEN
ncbi:hypothetical protein A374_06456 [Fictibacillus macauensis ZFHKF-1]|uniref:ATP-grasp domain-containing protein n=1 Tax=Fictibacillus macauensis ZFHKF-1 TaxID=1196324 RepID=I8AKU8_9BACL|nr:carbamoyl-phosphate synthase [Fictibacillus macauensis]EIT86219.1 hypothetical protein A374_06456 [Fictibacillus macauensis ZFHKF-1]